MNARNRRQRRDDIDDLIGDGGESPRRDYDEEKLSFSSVDAGLIQNGVSVQWLAKAFRLTRHVVERKLVGVRPVAKGRYNNPIYDLPEAASYLLEPKMNIKKYLETAKTDKLPEHLRETVWRAKGLRQKYEERARDLWRTETVMEKFSEVLIGVREKLQLIPDKLERLTGLSVEQYQMVRNTVDQVQEEIHNDILEMASRDRTPSSYGEEAEDYLDDETNRETDETPVKRGRGRPRKIRRDDDLI